MSAQLRPNDMKADKTDLLLIALLPIMASIIAFGGIRLLDGWLMGMGGQ